ncbi:MAG: lysozyme inhibitor LprI family protein [Methylococcaceae bacterium]
MKPSLFAFLCIVCSISIPVLADQTKQCLEVAVTQIEMNRCAGVEFSAVDFELNRVYKKIQELYNNDSIFLEKLKMSQLGWIKHRDADIELQYPHSEEPGYYGSALSMCVSGYKTKLTMQRVEFLKQWLNGEEEGDVCQGSIMNDRKITELMKK